VALTLPDDALEALRSVHPDTGWAIVKLLERGGAAGARDQDAPEVALLQFGGGRSLIVVNRRTMPALAGVQVIPLTESRAFLALDPGRSMSDLELAAIDRLADPALEPDSRRTLAALRAQLGAWRRDRHLQIRPKAIIVVEQTRGRRGRRSS
jgi:hypothetical protein